MRGMELAPMNNYAKSPRPSGDSAKEPRDNRICCNCVDEAAAM